MSAASFHCVDDIVQLGGERVDVLTVKRGDEGPRAALKWQRKF